MIDLSKAMNCIKVMKENGTYRGHKIGIVKKPINGQVSQVTGIPDYNGGEVVVFKEELSPSDAELCMGEYHGMRQKPSGTLTIECPLSPEELSKGGRGLITTVGTMVGVPEQYVEEVGII